MWAELGISCRFCRFCSCGRTGRERERRERERSERVASRMVMVVMMMMAMAMAMVLLLLGPPAIAASAASASSASSSSSSSGAGAAAASVDVDGRSAMAQTDEVAFICATLDWWPPDKCDYGTCSWANASLLNLNLSSALLRNAIRAFSPLKLRLGGTLQDNVVYHVGSRGEPCPPFVKNASHLFGFSGGCLPMLRWDELNHFFQSVGSVVAFGINALFGRAVGGGSSSSSSSGAWDPSNARDLIQYTHDMGYKISAWEFGNELSGSGIGTRVMPEQYAADAMALRKIVEEVYNEESDAVPLLVAPDGFFDEAWTERFLESAAAGFSVPPIDVLSHHIYNLGAGVDVDLMQKILDPVYLGNAAALFSLVQQVLDKHGRSVSAWVGESGGAYNSGHNLVTNAFVMGFWYLDQLGMSATFGTKTYCRQSLIGGNYGLLNTTTYSPNPDYYGALLWHRLMGSKVLRTNVSGSPFLRAYAHCSKGNGGVTIVFLNLSNQTAYRVDLSTQPASPRGLMRMEYHLTPENGDLHSQVSLLNGVPLIIIDEEIPILLPKVVASNQPISIQPLSYAFISLSTTLPACL